MALRAEVGVAADQAPKVGDLWDEPEPGHWTPNGGAWRVVVVSDVEWSSEHTAALVRVTLERVSRRAERRSRRRAQELHKEVCQAQQGIATMKPPTLAEAAKAVLQSTQRDPLLRDEYRDTRLVPAQRLVNLSSALAAHESREAETLALLKRAARFVHDHPCEEIPWCDGALAAALSLELSRREKGGGA